jgi:hypothetical protein
MPSIKSKRDCNPDQIFQCELPQLLVMMESCLTTETVQSAALSLEGIDDVQRGDGLALGVLSVGDSVTDDTLKEGLQNTTGLLVDH